jgi:oligopeptide/dipeptide ABC transporter ATP-binding protein
MNEVLRVEKLSILLRRTVPAIPIVENVDINIGEKEIVGVVGESGCGKTITSKAIMGLLPEDTFDVRGKVIFGKINLLELNRDELHRIRGRDMAWIPQDPMTSLNPVFTVEEQILDMLLWRGVSSISFIQYMKKKMDKEKISELKEKAVKTLERLRIPDPERVMKSYPIQLSGGMRQRILIAMALIGKPKLIIADEPGTSLDVSVQSETLQLMMDKVKEEGISELFITHDLAVAKRLCDRIYVMYAGNVCEVGVNAEIFVSPKHPYTLGLFDSVPKLTGNMGSGIPGMVPSYSDLPSGCRFHTRCPYSMEICKEIKPPLFKVSETHYVACHLYKGEVNGREHT